MNTEVSYIKTQWWRLLIALFCFVCFCVYAFQPAGPDTLEGLTQDINNMFSAGLFFCSFLIWSFISFIDYNQDRIELLEKKAEKYDAFCENILALNDANRIDREYVKLLEKRIKQLEERIR